MHLPERRPDGGEAPTTEAPTAVIGDGEEARLQRLERLGDLHKKGILTDAEFAAEKARVLGGDGGS
ncbi:MAG: SHOCT domain-containing protein [Thermoleophilia bacterium]|nr:SHOCT domain-containing protein [Thermoleophilia bacterium]